LREKKELTVSRPAIKFVVKVLIDDYLRLIKGIILEALVQARSDMGKAALFFGNHGVSEMWEECQTEFSYKSFILIL